MYKKKVDAKMRNNECSKNTLFAHKNASFGQVFIADKRPKFAAMMAEGSRVKFDKSSTDAHTPQSPLWTRVVASGGD